MGQSKAIINTSFWTDSKVDRFFSAEDKYFAMYLLSNSYINRLGIFELPIKQAAAQLGWSEDQVLILIDRFETKYEFLKYSKETGEIAIKNRLKYLDRGGKPILDELNRDKSKVKDVSLLKYIEENLRLNYKELNKTVVEFLKELSKVSEIPTLDEVRVYCEEKGYGFNPDEFFAYYDARHWMIHGGFNVAKGWRSKAAEWENRRKVHGRYKPNKFNNFHQRNYNYEELERDLLMTGGETID